MKKIPRPLKPLGFRPVHLRFDQGDIQNVVTRQHHKQLKFQSGWMRRLLFFDNLLALDNQGSIEKSLSLTSTREGL